MKTESDSQNLQEKGGKAVHGDMCLGVQHWGVRDEQIWGLNGQQG